ncbi:MAG: 30S ribosomal protein S20 [Chitinispirillia bacterium]|jgi:small subunit ribosomal protein S20
MPNHKSCKKRLLTTKKSTIFNRQIKSRISTALKKFKNADSNEAKESERNAVYSILDKAVKLGVIHKNKAANQKSKLHKIPAKK